MTKFSHPILRVFQGSSTVSGEFAAIGQAATENGPPPRLVGGRRILLPLTACVSLTLKTKGPAKMFCSFSELQVMPLEIFRGGLS